MSYVGHTIPTAAVVLWTVLLLGAVGLLLCYGRYFALL
jgi:hypothetical protein